MKYIEPAVRWFSSQAHLFYLFAFLLIIPNFVFFLTEPLPVPVRIASVLIPLACTMAVLLIPRKPGKAVVFLFPKILLDILQLVLLYLFGESVVAVDMFLNLTSSNPSEAGELLGNIFLVIIGCALIYIPALWLAVHSMRLRTALAGGFRKRWAGISAGILLAGTIICALPSEQMHRFSLKDDLYPANALYNLYFAVRKYHKNTHYVHTSARFVFDARKEKKAAGVREIYVLVVGETSRAMEWSLYGYDRSTTPRMEKQDGLVAFTDAVTQSNNTHKSVPIILSAACAENYDVIYNEKSIVTAFKEAGFKTYVIANQKLTLSMIGAFYREADVFIDVSKQHKNHLSSSTHDGNVLPYVDEAIRNTEGDLFIVLHTYGSHFNYHERYPKEFAFFKPDKVAAIRASHVKELRNAYDNSIRYTDYILAEITDKLRKSGACSALVYLSDHGEDIFDDARNRYLHASPIPTYYQLHIPYIIWFSDTYRREFPEKYQAASRNRALPVSTNSVFPTVLDVAAVSTAYADTTCAVTHPSFTVRDRMYLGDHDDPIPFYRVGLKKLDFQMLDRWKIAYNRDE